MLSYCTRTWIIIEGIDAKKEPFQLKSRLSGRKADFSTRNVGFSAEKKISGVFHGPFMTYGWQSHLSGKMDQWSNF
jgi:hypothetical protein